MLDEGFNSTPPLPPLEFDKMIAIMSVTLTCFPSVPAGPLGATASSVTPTQEPSAGVRVSSLLKGPFHGFVQKCTCTP